MTWWQTFLAAWAPFVLLAIGVLAAVVADAWRESRTADRWDQHEAHAEPPPPPQPTAVTSAEVRRWARTSGLQVSDRGPIPARVREAWLRAIARRVRWMVLLTAKTPPRYQNRRRGNALSSSGSSMLE